MLWFHNLKVAKIMKPSTFGLEKNETDGRDEAACRQFHFFFPDRMWRFHNFMPREIHETISQFYF